jgi:hypothetical protein
MDKFDIVLYHGGTDKPLPERNDFPSPVVDAGMVEEFSEGLVVIMSLQQVF